MLGVPVLQPVQPVQHDAAHAQFVEQLKRAVRRAKQPWLCPARLHQHGLAFEGKKFHGKPGTYGLNRNRLNRAMLKCGLKL
ncbi:MAG: hypothetical protein A3E79_06180 [Burkholderiales bacterium RIFCSPHIGHO2_12_FULL_61_11]|nr:MAG: hypothetical protein A3E79_06180 [Burkholderiales bacterium RIFCSPHIGHO2_12_FULL_61_11]